MCQKRMFGGKDSGGCGDDVGGRGRCGIGFTDVHTDGSTLVPDVLHARDGWGEMWIEWRGKEELHIYYYICGWTVIGVRTCHF